MHIINKSESSTRFILTLSENSEAVGPFTIELISGFDNKTYSAALGANLSTHTERYDEFLVSNSSFESVGPGKYPYVVKNATGEAVKHGVLVVVSDEFTPAEEVAELFVTVTPEEDEDDFMVYTNQ